MNKFKSKIVEYLLNLTLGLKILLCYLFWYLYFLVRYFRWDFSILGTALFMSLVVGIALNFNAYGSISDIRKGDGWKIARFFLIPFCVASYPLLIMGQNFILIFSPNIMENLYALLPSVLFLVIVKLTKLSNKREEEGENP
ncbi:MAG: hypothetical protein ACTSRK_08925 [Promethearchaeota archaeon]